MTIQTNEDFKIFDYYDAVKSKRLEYLLVFVFSFTGLFALEAHIRNNFPDRLTKNFYFQIWPSDFIMQTIEIEFMHEFGLQTLWYLHIQPPLFDFVRWVLSTDLWSKSGFVSGLDLDQRLYCFYIFIYACFNVLVYMWSQALGINRGPAIAITALWSIYPGNLAMATLLDSTYLSAFLIAVFIFALQETLRLKEKRYFYIFLLFFALASYTRTIFQIQVISFLPIIAFYLLTKFPSKKKPMVLAAVLGSALVFALPIKQYFLFGTTSTTTFAGQHKIEGIWYYPTAYEVSQIEVDGKYYVNARKSVNKFNSAGQVGLNLRYEELFRKIISENPNVVINGIEKSALQGLERLNVPTQNYWANAVVGFIPWSDTSAKLAIGQNYLALGTLVLVLFLVRLALRKNLLTKQKAFYYWPVGFWIVAIFLSIIIGSNRYEWTEAERLKFLIEFPVFIYIVSALYRLLNFKTRELPAVTN
jgi:hypothetical protein